MHKYLLPLLLLLCTSAMAQLRNEFGVNRATDTAFDKGHLRVSGSIMANSLATDDTTLCVAANEKGLLVLRKVATGASIDTDVIATQYRVDSVSARLRALVLAGNYLTSVDSTIYATTNRVDTGVKNTRNWSNGRFYLATNPAGYLTASDSTYFATHGDVDSAAYNVRGWVRGLGYLTSVDSSIYATTNRVDTGVKNTRNWANGRFYLASNPSGYISSAVTSVATGRGLAGGAITATGTLFIDSGAVYTARQVDSIRQIITVSSQATTTYTLVLSDAGKMVTSNNASAVSFTVPNNTVVAYPVNTYIQFENFGAGKLTLAAASGVTLSTTDGNLSYIQYAGGYIHKVGTNQWIVGGKTSN